MLKSSLLDILRTFSKQELIKFEDFIRSPYFNKKENVLKLFIEIKKYAPDFAAINLEKEKVWDDLFNGTVYNYGIMKNLIFDLNKLAEQFISELKFAADRNRQNEYLMNALLDRGLSKIYTNKQRSFHSRPDLKFIDENLFQISSHAEHVYKMYDTELIFRHQFDQDFKLEVLQLKRDSFLITNFLVLLFGAYNDAAAISFYRNTELESNPVTKLVELISPGMEKIIGLLGNVSAENSLYVKIYYWMFRTFSEKTEERYLEFKDLVFKNLKLLPKSNLQDLHMYLINSLSFLERGNLNRSRETVEIFDSLIANDAISNLKNGRIPVHVFNLYSLHCFALADPEKLRSFADRFLNKLEPELIKNTGNHISFMISFINKDFHEALNFISLLDIDYTVMKILLRWQKAMCLYETDNYETFLNEYDNLKHFLKNNKFIARKDRDFFNDHFYYTKRLFNLRQNFDRFEFLKLKDEISDHYKNTIQWFKEKLDEIGKANSKLLKT